MSENGNISSPPAYKIFVFSPPVPLTKPEFYIKVGIS